MRFRKRREQELDQEIQSHLNIAAQQSVDAGHSARDAKSVALQEFGNVALIKEVTRQMWGWTFWETLLQDIRYGLRLLRKSPVFSLVAILSLALGIGANTAIFGLIDAVSLRVLPVKDPKSLLILGTEHGARTGNSFYFETYQRLRAEQAAFEELAAFSPVRLNVSFNGENQPSVEGQLVSGNYFEVLGVGASIGRTFTSEDDRLPGGHPVAMISYSCWQSRFGKSRDAVGQAILIDGTPFTIVGVTRPGFFGMEVGVAPDITVPLMMQAEVMPDKENWLRRSANSVDWLRIFGRLKAGVTRDQAGAEMRVLYRNLQTQLAAELNPDWEHTWLKEWAEANLVLLPGATGLSDLRRQFSQPLFVLLAVVGLVLLIACTNVANLLLARASTRQREMAVRLAIGAGRVRLIRQLLVESLLLSSLGGALGILLALAGGKALVLFLSTGRDPISLDLIPDVRVFAFTAAVSIATGILFGLVPAFRAASLDLTPAMREGGHGTSSRQRLGKVLVASELALSLVLIIGAGLFVRSLHQLNSVDGTFARDRVLTVRLEPAGSDQKRGANAQRLNRLYLDLQARVAALPGVSAASLAGASPTSPLNSRNIRTPDGQEYRIAWTQVYSRYFESVGARVLAGRDFSALDFADGAPYVAVINQSLARRAFANRNPIGGRFTCSGSNACEVVGVVEDIPYSTLKTPPESALYMPFLQGPTGRGQMVLHVRFNGDFERIVGLVRHEVSSIDPNLPAFNVRTLATEVNAALIRERLLALLATVFGIVAGSLAAIGLYGIVSYAVGRRTREIGVRMVLGASPGVVSRMILSDVFKLAGIGVLCGLPLAVGATRLIAGFLYGIQPLDPFTILSSIALMLGIALIAGYIPSRRASKIDPLTALRNE